MVIVLQLKLIFTWNRIVLLDEYQVFSHFKSPVPKYVQTASLINHPSFLNLLAPNQETSRYFWFLSFNNFFLVPMEMPEADLPPEIRENRHPLPPEIQESDIEEIYNAIEYILDQDQEVLAQMFTCTNCHTDLASPNDFIEVLAVFPIMIYL